MVPEDDTVHTIQFQQHVYYCNNGKNMYINHVPLFQVLSQAHESEWQSYHSKDPQTEQLLASEKAQY